MLSNIVNLETPESLAQLLRAAGDPLRLRLLQLCADRPAAVNELAAALGEGEPNVSRHLKQLAAAGLLVRARRGQRVEYAVAAPGGGLAATLCRQLLDRIDCAEPQLREARARLGSNGSGVRGGAGRIGAGRIGRTLLAELGAALRRDANGQRVIARCPWAELLEFFLRESAGLLPFARSASERAVLRRWAQGAGLALRPAMAAELEAGRRPSPAFGLSFELVSAGDADAVEALHAAAAFARQMIGPTGVAWLAIDYEALEPVGDGQSPPARLRAALGAAGLDCQSLFPVEADGCHLLVARAPAAALPQAVPMIA